MSQLSVRTASGSDRIICHLSLDIFHLSLVNMSGQIRKILVSMTNSKWNIMEHDK